jgi:hypothetical protein
LYDVFGLAGGFTVLLSTMNGFGCPGLTAVFFAAGYGDGVDAGWGYGFGSVLLLGFTAVGPVFLAPVAEGVVEVP